MDESEGVGAFRSTLTGFKNQTLQVSAGIDAKRFRCIDCGLDIDAERNPGVCAECGGDMSYRPIKAL